MLKFNIYIEGFHEVFQNIDNLTKKLQNQIKRDIAVALAPQLRVNINSHLSGGTINIKTGALFSQLKMQPLADGTIKVTGPWYGELLEDGGRITPTKKTYLSVPAGGMTRPPLPSHKNTYLIPRGNQGYFVIQKAGTARSLVYTLVPFVVVKQRPWLSNSIRDLIPYSENIVNEVIQKYTSEFIVRR